jgi:hypothetical protein
MMNIGIWSPSRLAAGATALAPLLAVALTLGLAACSGNSPAPASAAPTATANASSAAGSMAARAAGSVTKGAIVKVPKYVAADNVREYVSAIGCAQAGRLGWRLNGIASNTTSLSRAYAIVVDFVTVQGNTVLDTKLLNVGPIKPKSAMDWSVTGAAGQHHVACVIREALAK